jgi:hypothetical protein
VIDEADPLPRLPNQTELTFPRPATSIKRALNGAIAGLADAPPEQK